MTARLAIIGAGRLGGRHLQALALLDRPATVEIVDPHPESLKRAQGWLDEIHGTGNLRDARYLSEISELSGEIDAAIIATVSPIREQVLEQLLAVKKVRYLILEKVLFQRKESFTRAKKLLDSRGVKAWVNCPRRMWPLYKDIRSTLQAAGESRIEYIFTGSQWGLGSNAIHFLDHLAFLAGQSDYELSGELLDDTIVDSKRPGFIEFTGTLTGLLGDKSRLTLASYATGAAPRTLELISPSNRWIINEADGTMLHASEHSSWAWKEKRFAVPMQSRLTHLAMQQLLDHGDCDLTPYDESVRLHLPVLSIFLAHMKKVGRDAAKGCPIT